MAILAVVDTFLVYKIAERRYNRNVAVIASVLFAVMPSLLYNRWILLDNILIPLLLSSILFALYHYKKDSSPDKYGNDDGSSGNKTLIPILMSGVFLGLAIFTKIPTFTMIPVVGFIIFTNNNRRNLRVLGLWLIPIILIPSIWPAYNIAAGHFNEWRNGIIHQETRGIYYKGDKILPNALKEFFKVDPVLFVIGICGLFYVAIRKDVALVLWVVPYLIFLYFIVWTTYFHLLIMLPAFCIAAAVLLENISQAIRRRIIITSQKVLLPLSSSPFLISSAIGIFGLISSIMLITANHTLHNFVIFAFITQHLPDLKNTTNDDNNNKVIMIGSLYLRSQYWLYKYAFNKDFDFMSITDAPINDTHFMIPFKTQKVLFIADPFLSQIDEEGPLKQINQLHNNTHAMAIFDRGLVKIRSNYY
jgi:4-amino-4-deoxy-L-arabinose transferase-like glycosyltransferase